MYKRQVNVPEREDVLRLLEKIVRLENQDSPYLGGELKRLKGGRDVYKRQVDNSCCHRKYIGEKLINN